MSKSHGDIETPDPVPVTSEYITRLFLYGDPITPAHIPDRLRDDSQSGATGEVDAQQYMNTYAQYAVPARAGLVQKFFEGQISLLPGTYTSEYLASVVGGAEAQFSYVNAYVDIGGNNDMERAYIFGHAAFYISPDSLFVVEAGGTRRMENVRVVPEEDNFDFVSTGISQILNDNVLQPRIDPFEIGKTVTIQFSDNLAAFSYTSAQYALDKQRIAEWDGNSGLAATVILANIYDLMDRMESEGVFEYERDGKDIVYGSSDDDLLGNFSNSVILVGGAGDDQLSGSGEDDIIYGGKGSDVLIGGEGSDELFGDDGPSSLADGIDAVDYSSGNSPITIRFDGPPDSTYDGVSFSLSVQDGTGGTDTLHSIEKVVGTAGRDYLWVTGWIATGTNLTIDASGGQSPNPRATINGGDAVAGLEVHIDPGNVGTGYVRSKDGATTGGQIDLEGFHTYLVGSAFDDEIIDNSDGEKRIDGGAGDDVISVEQASARAMIWGGDGNDTITGGSGNDIITGGSSLQANDLYTDHLNGGAGSDYIVSTSNDIVDGGIGDDYIQVLGSAEVWGGAGNDVIVVAAGAGALIHLASTDGHDALLGRGSAGILFPTAQYTDFRVIIGAVPDASGDFEGFADVAVVINATGASLFIPGLHVSASQSGGGILAGFDRFVVWSGAGDVDYGYGSVEQYRVDLSGFAAAVAPAPEDTIGTPGNDDLKGGTGDDSLFGGAGDDVFESSGGSDTINGGTGNDELILFGSRLNFIAMGGSWIALTDETGAEGTITMTGIESVFFVTDGASFTMPQLVGGYWGTVGNDVIEGSLGDDSLYGLEGNDFYFVNTAEDQVFETAGNGFDTVFASFSYTLAPEVERVFALDPNGTAALNFTGNDLANELGGTAGANILDGGAGADLMVGGDGDDIYFVDNAGDVVSESPTGGYDTVFTSISFVLETRIERVVALDPAATTALSLTGNASANEISGNAGGNLIDGGGGADVLLGLGGADAFAFSALGGGNLAQLPDFEVGIDRFYLDDAAFAGLAPGVLAAGAFHIGAAAADADDRIVYDSATGALYFDADGNGAGLAVQFANLHEGLPLNATDFQVI